MYCRCGCRSIFERSKHWGGDKDDCSIHLRKGDPFDGLHGLADCGARPARVLPTLRNCFHSPTDLPPGLYVKDRRNDDLGHAGGARLYERRMLDACKLRPRNRLMRKTVRQEVPIVVWTVEYVCERCARGVASSAFAHRMEPAELSHYFSSSSAPVQQWSGAAGERESAQPRSQAPASPLDGLIRAVRDYVERQ